MIIIIIIITIIMMMMYRWRKPRLRIGGYAPGEIASGKTMKNQMEKEKSRTCGDEKPDLFQ